jgi:hypothetical protein
MAPWAQLSLLVVRFGFDGLVALGGLRKRHGPHPCSPVLRFVACTNGWCG